MGYTKGFLSPDIFQKLQGKDRMEETPKRGEFCIVLRISSKTNVRLLIST